MNTVATPIDHYATGSVMRLSDYVRMRRQQAADADWGGDARMARFWDCDDDEAIKAGEDPVYMH